MYRLTALLFLLLPAFARPLAAQPVPAEVSAKEKGTVSILRVYPDSFPDVSVFFKAETFDGEPLWRLDTADIDVLEDGEHCRIKSLRQVSEQSPVRIALVLDHSSSMRDEFIFAFDTINGQLVLKGLALRGPDEPYAIDLAKKGVIDFMQSLDITKDELLVVGFSDLVDPVPPMSGDTAALRQVVSKMESVGATAFYDALLTAQDSLEEVNGLRAIVALTDGEDNSSKVSLDSVISRSVEAKIPVYVVGLGNVGEFSLRRLATETKGEYFYTAAASSLSDIYMRISRKVRAIYELVYASRNLSGADGSRQVELIFDLDSVALGQPLESFDLPVEVIEKLKARENKTRLIVGGGLILLALVGLGILILRKRGEREPVEHSPAEIQETLPLPRAFPNPSSGHTTFSLNLPEDVLSAELHLFNVSGKVLRKYSVSGPGGWLEVDLSGLANGAYFFRVLTDEAASASGKLLLAK